MPKDKSKPSIPLFDDPFAEPVEVQEVRDAEVKTKVDSDKQSAAKTKPTSRKQAPKKATAKPKTRKKAAAKPGAEKKAATPEKSKPASKKPTTKKATAKPTTRKKAAAKSRAEKKAAAPAKSKPASKKPTSKKTKAKPTARKKAAAKPGAEKKAAAPAKSKPASTKPTTKKTKAKPTARKKAAVKPGAEKKAAALEKPKAVSRKQAPKKAMVKPKVEEKITLEAEQEIPPVHVLEKSRKTVEIEEQPTKSSDSLDESDQGTTLPSDTSATLLETLLASLDEDDKDYERRALAALPFVQRTKEIEGEQHVVFYLSEREYALPIESMIEIGEPLTITPVPNVPDWVLGVANLRGDILSVVDLRVFLGMPPRSQGEGQRMLVTQSSDKEISTCLIVDGVRGIRYLQMDQVAEHIPPATDLITQFVDGVLKLDENDIMVLNIDRLLLSERMQTFS